MLATYTISTSTTVGSLATTLYDVVDPFTSTVDAARQAHVEARLRLENPDLPSDETSFDSGLVALVWLPRLPAAPFRVRDLVPELQGIGIRNIEQLAAQDAAELSSLLAGPSPSEAECARAIGIAMLMRVPGLSYEIADTLFVAGITRPRELAEADQAALKTTLSAAVPPEVGVLKPWRVLQNRTIPRIGKKRRLPLQVAPVPVRGAAALAQVNGWDAIADDPSVSSTERRSAETIARLLGIEADYLEGNARYRRGKAKAGYAAHRDVWRQLGAWAVDEGLATAGTDEADGPSLSTIISLMGVALDRILPEHSVQASRALGGSTTSCLQAFALADLQSGPAGDVVGALGAEQLAEASPRFARWFDKAISDRPFGDLAFLTGSVTSGTTTARTRDLGTSDTEQFRQNARAVTFSTLQSQEPALWAEAQEALTLREVRGQVGTALGTNPQSMAILGTPAVQAAYPAPFLQTALPFDRFVKLPYADGSDTAFIALNDGFETEYRTSFMAGLFAAGDAAMDFGREAFADPARFACVLPVLLARQAPLAMLRESAGMVGAKKMAAVGRGLVVEAAALSGSLDTTLLTAETVGERGEGPSDPYYLTIASHKLNRKGDLAYQEGRLDDAAASYKKVLRFTDEVLPAYAAQLAVVAEQIDATMADVVSNDLPAPTVTLAGTTVVDPALDTAELLLPELGAVDQPLVVSDQLLRYLARGGGASTLFLVTAELNISEDGREGSGDSQAGRSADRNLPVTRTGNRSAVLDEDDEADVPEMETMDAFVASAKALALYARKQLSQIEAGLNYLGLDRDAPPIWRFDYLVEQARYYAGRAETLQQRALSLLDTAESKALEEFDATSAMQLASAETRVARANADVAQARLDEANTAVAQAERALTRQWVSSAAGVVIGAASAAMGVGALVAAAKGGEGAITSLITGGQNVGSASQTLTGVADGIAQAKDAVERAELRSQTARKENVAAVLAEGVAQLRFEENAARLGRLMHRATSDELYFALADLHEEVAGQYLYMANRLAWLAERAYEFDTKRIGGRIQQSYVDPGTTAARFGSATALLHDLDSVQHEYVAATTNHFQQVQLTISWLEHQPCALMALRRDGSAHFSLSIRDIDRRFPGLYLHSVHRVEVEVIGLLPEGGVRGILHRIGSGRTRVPRSSRYVEATWSALDPDVWADWAYPVEDYPLDDPTSGSPPAFVMKPDLAVGGTQILSEAGRSGTSMVLAPPNGALDTLENVAVEGQWLLELPREANAFDTATIEDVRLTLTFSAHYSPALHARQLAFFTEAPDHASGSESRAMVRMASASAADDLARFVNGPTDTSLRDVRTLPLPIPRTALPPALEQFRLENVLVALVGLPTPLTLRLAGGAVTLTDALALGHKAATALDVDGAVDGSVFSAVGLEEVEVPTLDGTSTEILVPALEGTYGALDTLVSAVSGIDLDDTDVLVTWGIKVLAEDNPDYRLLDDDGDPVLVSAGNLRLAPGEGASYTGAAWRHARATFHLAPVSTTTGWNVSATLIGLAVTIGFDGTTFSVTVDGSTRSMTPASGACDAVYALTLEVVGDTAQVLLDGIPVAEDVAVAAGSGTLALSHTGGASDVRVSGVQVTRLRYDGSPLEQLVDERFEALDAWTLTGSPSAEVTDHHLLDLSAVRDVLLTMDYRARVTAPSEA